MGVNLYIRSGSSFNLSDLRDALPNCEAVRQVHALRQALERSVELQSHYATLLNLYDGGKRMTFKDADEWIARLEQEGGAA